LSLIVRLHSFLFSKSNICSVFAKFQILYSICCITESEQICFINPWLVLSLEEYPHKVATPWTTIYLLGKKSSGCRHMDFISLLREINSASTATCVPPPKTPPPYAPFPCPPFLSFMSTLPQCCLLPPGYTLPILQQ